MKKNLETNEKHQENTRICRYYLGNRIIESSRNILKPFWLRGTLTQDELHLYELKQLRLLSIYGIGGCTPYNPTKEELELWYRFAKGEHINIDIDKEHRMKKILSLAMPRGYKRIIVEGEDCRHFFFNEHNNNVMMNEKNSVLRDLCLAKVGRIISIRQRKDYGCLQMDNIWLLNSDLGRSLETIGTVIYIDGKEEQVFLDFLPSARIGSEVIVHRNIACEVLNKF